MWPEADRAPVTSNFTVSDLLGIAQAFFLYPLFTVIPGYVCGWLMDAFGFRVRSFPARSAIAVALSIGISPILAYLTWHLSLAAVWAVFGVIWIGFAALAVLERRIWFSRSAMSKARRGFLGIVAGWVGLGTLSLVDLQFKDRLYFSLVSYDYMFRTAVTSAISRTGIPPQNPYFFPGRTFVLRYHYFWFILSSLVSQLGSARVSPRQALMAGTLWAGIGLIALIPLYLRFFQAKGAKDLDRRMLWGVGLLCVTGVNILPVGLIDIFSRNFILSDLAVVPWADQVLWAPHHAAALVACLTGFLLLWYRRDLQGMQGDLWAAAGAGIMFASGLGLSVYVTMVAAAFVTVWAMVSALRRRFREARLACLAGVVALCLSVPYIRELLGRPMEGTAGGGASGGPLLQFAIRSFPITEALFSGLHSTGLKALATLLVLPLNYFLELGFLFLIGLLQWRKLRAAAKPLPHPELCGLVMAATGWIVCTFVRSGVINVNDLGIRGFMLVQFVLLLWGAELLHDGTLGRIRRSGRVLLAATLLLGVAGTVYDVGLLRSFAMLTDATNIPRHAWLSPDRNLGARTYALRRLYDQLKGKLPLTAVIQHNPDTDPGDLPHGLYADRQTAAETLQCLTVFGGDPALCPPLLSRIRILFEKQAALADYPSDEEYLPT